MDFEEQKLGNLFKASDLATDYLYEACLRKAPLTLYESLFLQAASHLVQNKHVLFSASEVCDITRISQDTVRRIAGGFVTLELLSLSDHVDFYRQGRPPKLYTPTQIGAQVLTFFDPEMLENLGLEIPVHPALQKLSFLH